MPASHAACSVAAAVGSSTLTNNSPSGADPKPSCVTSTPVLPSLRVSPGFICASKIDGCSAATGDAALERFEQDRAEDDSARRETLPEDFDTGEIEEVPGERDDDDADDRAQNLSLSAIEARPADHDSRNDLELETLAGIRRNSPEPRQAHEPGERSCEAHHHQALDLDPVGANAGEHRHGLARADRIDALAERRSLQNEPANRVDQHGDPDNVLDRKPDDQRLAGPQPAGD